MINLKRGWDGIVEDISHHQSWTVEISEII